MEPVPEICIDITKGQDLSFDVVAGVYGIKARWRRRGEYLGFEVRNLVGEADSQNQ